MSENNIRRTRLLEDLDKVRNKISELEESENKHTEERTKLKDDIEQYRMAADDAQLGLFILDVQGKIRYLNISAQKNFELPPLDKIGETELGQLPSFKKTELAAQLKQCLVSQKQSVFEIVVIKGDSQEAWMRLFINPIFNKDGSINGVFGVVEDITMQKKKENDLSFKLGLEKSSHKVLSGLVGVVDIDDAINKTLANLGELCGVSRAFLFLLYENDTKMDNTHEWCAAEVNPILSKLQNLAVDKFPWWIKKLDNGECISSYDWEEMPDEAKAEKKFLKEQGIKSILLVPIRIKNNLAGFLGYSMVLEPKQWTDKDIRLLQMIEKILGGFLERKRTDDVKKERDERFRRLAQASFEGIIIIYQDKICDTNHIAGALLGYKPSEFPGKNLMDFIVEKERAHVRKNLQAGSIKPFETLGKKKDGAIIPIELQARTIPSQEKSFLFVSIRDISERRNTLAAEKQSMGQLKEALEGSLKAMAATIALRDPFSAGHEQGVAQLACAIAAKMGLTEDRIEGLRYAALIHDIGKICIPAEILSKPGKITPAERMIIQEHPRVGHNVLKDVVFPWPVADMIMQHHERMNGSGYPEGLAGDNIILEARILAVADKVEAILSSRSYHPAGTIKDALDEISKNKGILYDPDVAEAALSILSTDSFKLDS